MDAGLLSASATASQYFIYSMVKEYGALVFAATMNVRQVLSILVSYKTYHHAITPPQVAGLMVIFGALFFKSYNALTDKGNISIPSLRSCPAWVRWASVVVLISLGILYAT